MLFAHIPRPVVLTQLLVIAALAVASPRVSADTFFFNSGAPDGKMGMASRPDAGGKIEVEAADDFITTGQTQVNHATFTGLVTSGVAAPTIGQVAVEIYRVFPND